MYLKFQNRRLVDKFLSHIKISYFLFDDDEDDDDDSPAIP